MKLASEGYVISKTNNKSVIASMNAISENIEASNFITESYDSNNIDAIEDLYIGLVNQ